MKENNIALKSIRELLDMKFFVPSYQRGYRWTKQQVTDLLKDIRDFSKKKSNEYEFYCLQPLVVRQMNNTDKQKNNLEVNATWYEVIDGQQRLTTIYLILFALKDVIKIMRLPSQLYELKYQREANKQNGDLNNVTNLEQIDTSTIDSFHLSTAYQLIKKWFDKQGDNVNIADFCNVLLKYDPDKNTPQRDKANNIRVIWYESVGENPVNVFTRLNIGKIALSNSELIKALFLNSSNFGDASDHYVRLRQQEMASEWDNIEYTFQNEEFWLLLHKKEYDRPTRIDFIFDLICQQNLFKFTPEAMKSVGADDYKTFRYFYEYFKTTENVNVVECWQEVKKYHQIFMEWFNDIQFYHYVGYLIACEQHSIVRLLIDKWMCTPNKTSFLSYLKDEIKNVIERCPKLDYEYKVDGSDKCKCRPILLFHNIQTVINQNICQRENEKYQLGSFYKFPFHLYKLENWDVEHINSNTTNEENESATQKEWLLNVYLSVDSELRKRIQDSIKGGEESIKACQEEIKKQMSEQEEWTQEEKNKIWNYTLLDSSTNRSYGNALFSGKRGVIISKDRGVLMSVPKLLDGNIVMSKEPKIKSSFVPPCTKQVFMKYYSCTPGDSNYWLKHPDAQAYMEDIEECIRQLDNK